MLKKVNLERKTIIPINICYEGGKLQEKFSEIFLFGLPKTENLFIICILNHYF